MLTPAPAACPTCGGAWTTSEFVGGRESIHVQVECGGGHAHRFEARDGASVSMTPWALGKPWFFRGGPHDGRVDQGRAVACVGSEIVLDTSRYVVASELSDALILDFVPAPPTPPPAV